MVSAPRLVIAAPASNSGKTTVATGLMAAFAARGLAVSPHKVGPDYIDPGYHALATGRPGRNLDAYMCGPELIAPLFAHGSAGCDLAVVEGVMGLYDGASGQGELASTAQVAKLLKAPVVLVVDASSQSRSVAALVHGFASWDPRVRIGGVILNKVASDRHEALLRDALDESGLPVLGVIRRAPQVATPSRHLGLVPVAERGAEAVDAVRAMGERVRAGCDLDALMALARTAPALPDAPWEPAYAPAREASGPVADGPRPVVAVAGGAAFTFAYAEHAELLAAAGAEVVTFDPLRDEKLPAGTAGIVVGGGFPEVYAPELSANEPLRRAVTELARAGAPVAAECAGLLYLARELDGKPMCGVLDAEARMSGRLTLGYRQAVAVSDSVLAVAGTRMRGHEFHRTVLEPGAGATPAWGMHQPERRVEGYVERGVHASYLHTHWAASPEVARRFVAHCRAR
ncbi:MULTISPECIES: cobyrinate a,c-diamide synthase [Streptomyces]|uniref:cobyrinate a,c-diamide synthase n=1 Tax=Streptomyces TaxID=1883 RepID=UPI0004C15E2F|nr:MULTISPECIES: cobyrinate a,c-diamide synthase [Streptomyces]MYW78969.1 cobyrinate a,c-diamide synthase [Streptomyces sp. SID8369]QRV57653.1 cobyrinate a,c-diamide synthase [Streptomyces californicus]SDE15803.1 hydrogenobyrinic acid a,c-diamide synthase (glutamine-hydrolysing) [Streptomyces sp. LaPpAH-199]